MRDAASGRAGWGERPWAIIGAGRVGRTLGLLARQLDVPLTLTWNRSAPRAEATARLLGLDAAASGPLPEAAAGALADAGVIWVTVADDALADVAAALAADLRSDQLVLHTSGSLSADVLRQAGIAGPVGSAHPLQSIVEPRRAVRALGAVTWAVEGDPAAVDYACAVLGAIGVEPVRIDGRAKVYYHASAVMAANLFVALIDAAVELGERAGMTAGQARTMLLPLVDSCIDNLRDEPPADALTGPVARGDEATVAAHLSAIEALGDDNLRAIYDSLTERARHMMRRDDD